MKNIVFIDGSQGVGKSTLIEGLKAMTPFYLYKFPFSDYSEVFNLRQGGQLKGFQLGKDLATLFFLSKVNDTLPCSFVIDRGPMSTVYYSLTTGRMSVEEVEEFFKILSKTSNKFTYVFVVPKNNGSVKYSRAKGDGFDLLKGTEVDTEKAVDLMVTLSKTYGVKLKIFENDFSLSIKANVDKFYRLLKEDL